MTDRYKFRGLRVSDNTWVYGYYSTFETGSYNNSGWIPETKHVIIHKFSSGGIQWHEVLQESVGQFIKTVKGVDIYEHDHDEDYTVLEYCGNCMGYQPHVYDFPTKDRIHCCACEGDVRIEEIIDDFVVTGNLHQYPHPELIK